MKNDNTITNCLLFIICSVLFYQGIDKYDYSKTTQDNYNKPFKEKHYEVDRISTLYDNLPDVTLRNHFITGCRVAANITGGGSQMMLHTYKNCEACREANKQDLRQVLREFL